MPHRAAQQLADIVGVGPEGGGEEGEVRRVAALLQVELELVVDVLQRGGDHRAVPGRELLGRVEDRAEEVAVAGEARPQRRAEVRQGLELVAAAQQQLHRVDGAGGDDHQRRPDRLARERPAVAVVDAVAAGLGRDGEHLGERLHDRAVALLGHRQIVEVERVLGVVAAADVALAAVAAGLLHDVDAEAVGIAHRRPVGVEGGRRRPAPVDRQVRPDGRRADPLAGGAVGPRLRQLDRPRQRGDAEHPLDATVIGGQRLRPHPGGPALAEGLPRRAEVDVGVGVRATADAAGGDGGDPLEHADVEETVPLAGPEPVRQPPLAEPGELVAGAVAAPLEHQHPPAALRQPAGGHRAAEP